jgi:hypothetical protein
VLQPLHMAVLGLMLPSLAFYGSYSLSLSAKLF